MSRLCFVNRVSLGQPPSLHHLRGSRRTGTFVRGFFGTMRLSDFPLPYIPYPLGVPRVDLSDPFRGRFWDLPVPVQDVSVRARGLRPRRVQTCLALTTRPMLPSATSHGVGTLDFNRISRLNTRPAFSLVNASAMALLPPPHDSGPMWFAKPSSYDSFIHDTLPVLTGAFVLKLLNIP